MRTIGFLAVTIVSVAMVSHIHADDIENTSFAYDRYYADEDSVTSPSDVPVPSPEVAPVDPIITPAVGFDSCCNGCDSNGCASSCCDSCCNSCCSCNCGWCNLGDPWKLQKCENCYGITYGGWVQIGYHSQNTPLSFVDNDLFAFNDLPGRLNAHQVWGYIEREAEGECEWDFGFRADLMYGTDGQKTQAFGGLGWDNGWDSGEYGGALPQLYVTADRDDLTIMAGHFFTLVGYEVVAAPGNFFYSHSLTMFNSEPFTHTGILASYDVAEDVTVYGGWTLGWDTGFENFNDGNNFLGGISVPLLEDLTLTYITTIGDMGRRGSGYSHSLVFDWEINDDWEYVLQSDMVALDANAINGGFFNDQVGVNQYLFYKINDCLKAGGRFEWWQTDNQDRYEMTLGVNVQPHANVMIRPEIRYDWGSQALVPVNNGEATVFGVDAYFTF